MDNDDGRRQWLLDSKGRIRHLREPAAKWREIHTLSSKAIAGPEGQDPVRFVRWPALKLEIH